VKIEVQLKGFLSPKAVYRGMAVVEDPFYFQKPMLKQAVLSLTDIKASSEEDNIPASVQFSIEVTSPSVPNSLQERRRSIIQTVIEKGGGHHLEDSDAAGDNEESSEESDISVDDPKSSVSKSSRSSKSLPPIAKKSIKGKPPKIDHQKRSAEVEEFIQSGLVDEDDSNHESGHSDSDHDSELNYLPPRKSIPMKPVQKSVKDSSMPKSVAQQFNSSGFAEDESQRSRESKSDDDSLSPPPAPIVASTVHSPDKNIMLHTFLRKGSIDEDNSNTEEDDSEAEEEVDTLQQNKRKHKSKVRKDRISREMAVEQLLSNSTLDDEETIHTFDATNDLRLSPDDDSSVIFVVEEQVAPKLSYSQSLSLSMDHPVVKNSQRIENTSTFDSHEQNEMYISPYLETLPKQQRKIISEETHGNNEQLKQRFSSEEEDSDREEEENVKAVKRVISSSRSDFYPKVIVVEDRVVADTDQSNPFFTADSDEDDASLVIQTSDEKPKPALKAEVLINPFLLQNNDSDKDEDDTTKAKETNFLEPSVQLFEDSSSITAEISTEQPFQQRKSLKILFGIQGDEPVVDHAHLTKIAAIDEHIPTNDEDNEEEEEWEKTVRSNTVAAQETPSYQEKGFAKQSEEQKPEQLQEQSSDQLPSSNQYSSESFLKDQEISLLQNELQTVLEQKSVVATKLEDQSLKENSLLLHIQDLSNKLQTLMLENQENKKTLEKVQREKEELEAHQKEKERLLKEEAVKKEHEKEIEILQSEWLNDRGNQFRLHEEETVLEVPKNEISIFSFQRAPALTVAVENPLLSRSYSSSNLENEINRTSSLDLETAVSTPKSSEEIEILKSKVSAYEEYNNKLQQDLLDMKRKTKSKALIEAALSNMLTRRSLNIPMHKRDSFHDQQLLLQNSIQEGTSPVPEREIDETERPKSTYSVSNEEGIFKNTVPAVNNPTPVRVIERRRGIFDPNTMTLSDITPFTAPESSSSHHALKPQNSYNYSNNNYTITPISSRTTTPLPTHLRGSTSQQFYQDDAASIYAPSDTTPRNASFYLPKTKRLTAEDRKKSRLSLISNLPGSKGSILISPSPTNISAATATAVSNVFVEEKKISEAVKEFTMPLKKTLSAMILKDKTENNQNQSNNQSKGTDKQKRDAKTPKGDLSTPSEEDKNEIIENRVVELVELPAFLLENTSLTVLSAIPSTKSNLADSATKVGENEKRRQSTPSKAQQLALQQEEKENRQLQLFTKFSFSLKENILFEKKFSRMSEDGKTARNLLTNPSGLSEKGGANTVEGSVSILPFQGQSQQQEVAEQPTVIAKSNMKYYYSELFECLGDAIRSGVLRCFRIMELSIMPSPTSALLGHSHDNRDSASSIANNPLNRRRSVSNVSGGFFPSRQQTMTSSYDSQVNTRAKKLLESDSVSVRNNTTGNTPNTTWNQDQGKNRRGSLIPFSNSDQPMDLSSLFQLLLQSHNPDEQLRTKVYISLSSMVRIDSVDAFLNHVKILFDANELYLHNDSSLLSGQLWDISPLFNSARYLINLFGNNDETSLNANTNSTFLTGMNGSNLTVPNHSLTGKASVNITTVFSKLKSLQESLKQQLILYHEHLFWTTKMGLLPSSTVPNTEGNPPNAFLTTSSNPLDSALDEMKHFHDRLTEESFYALQSLAGLTYFHQTEHHHHHHHHHHQSHSKPQTTKRLPPLRSTSLLQSCEALLAQFMIFLLPKNFALLEFMLRISCLSEVLNKNKLYFKNVQNNYEMYKNCKKLFKALKIQQKLEKELLEISAVDSIVSSSPVIQNRNRSNSSGNDSSTCRQQISSVIEELDTLLDKQLHPAGSSSTNIEENKNTFREHSVSPSKDPTSVNPLSITQGPLRRASYVYFQQTSSAPANSSSLLCDGKYCLEKIKSIIMKSDEIYHRYTVYKESLQSLASYKNAFDSSSSSSSDDDEGDKDGFGSLTDEEEVKRIYSDLELSDNEKIMHNKSGPPSSQRKSFVGSRKVLPTENSPLKQSSSVVLSARKSSFNHEQQSSIREKNNSPQITFHQSQKAPFVTSDKSKPTKRINHEKLEERKLDKMASELFHYKEDMKKKLSLLTSFINFEETEHFIKAIPNPESLSNKCYEMVYKRDENNYNIATLLLQIKSKKLLASIYSTWPSLSFEIPSEPDRSSGSFYEGANNSNTPGIMTGSSPMLTTMSRSKSFIHKTVSYHDELFPAKPIGGGSSATSAMNSPQKFSNSLQSVVSRVGGSGNTVGGGRSVYSSAGGIDNQSSGSHQTNNIMKHLDYLTSQQEAMQFCYAKDIDLTLFESFHNTKGLRKIGFTLLQLRDSKCFTWNQLLSAGYPLNEIKYLRGTVAASPSTSSLLSGRPNQNPHHHDHSFELTVPELRKAGYTIEQCVKAGFNIKAIKSGGFDELQLVQCGLFTTKQLLSAGCDIQRYVLKNFYELTNGKYWNHSDNWNSSLPLSKWYGIKTDSYGHILSIDLRSNELYGCLPESLYLLTTLQSLDLFNNHLRGNFPASYSNLVNLKDLWLDGNPELKQNISKQQLQKLLPSCRIRL
jgi:hypothetical protein